MSDSELVAAMKIEIAAAPTNSLRHHIYSVWLKDVLALEARIKELESQKLSERVTDDNLDHLYFKVADEVIPQTVFNEIVREWLKEMER